VARGTSVNQPEEESGLKCDVQRRRQLGAYRANAKSVGAKNRQSSHS
jgi:hypothetical protein